MSITLHQGSILDSTADFIVNPANSHLRHGGGLAAIIEAAATGGVSKGKEAPTNLAEYDAVRAWFDAQTAAPLVPTGGACVTTPGLLPFKGVIHAVGPVYGGGSFFESALLGSAHAESLAIAQENGAESIAFPAISCGIFGYPVERAAQVAVRACMHTRLRVEFWLFEDAHMEAFTAAMVSAGLANR